MATRKQFLKTSISAAAGLVAAAVHPRVTDALEERTLRPPGAVDGFHDACAACAACADVCPERAIVMRPHKLSDKPLPSIVPSERACVMCEDTPCITACNDGALVAPPDGVFPAIGVAVVVADSCLAYNDSVCMTCFDACPLKRSALKIEKNRPLVDPAACTGCGQCACACPIGEKGISLQSR